MISLPHYNGKTVFVLGLGKTGRATAAAMAESGATVFVWDDRSEERVGDIPHGCTRVAPEDVDWASIDAFFPSPGIVPSHKAFQLARNDGRLMPSSDIEALMEAQPGAKFIGITGTNGKSTTTALTAHILQKCGQNVQMGGNIGTPALALDPFMKTGVYVLEASSYQLELMDNHRFHLAALLNIEEDHMDRYGDMGSYVAAKLKIFETQTAEDAAIIGVDDKIAQAMYQGLMSQNRQSTFPISGENPVGGGCFFEGTTLIDDMENSHQKIHDFAGHGSLKGAHNMQNIACAYQMARLMGCAPKEIVRAVESFTGLPHRQEFVTENNGVTYINDSKATSPASTFRALRAFQNIHWILGGMSKKDDLSECIPYYPAVKAAYVYGQDQEVLARAIGDALSVQTFETLAEATQAAHNAAKKSDTVLLSPACASWDQFDSFEHRGETFKEEIAALLSQSSGSQSATA